MMKLSNKMLGTKDNGGKVGDGSLKAMEEKVTIKMLLCFNETRHNYRE